MGTTKEVEVLDDIVFDEEKFKEDYPDKNDYIARSIFDKDKSKLLELHRKQSYDNYVTGGGTIKTDKYYMDSNRNLSEYAKYCYKVIEVYRNTYRL